MATSEALITRLNNLLMLDHDAVEAYQQAIDRLQSLTCKGRLQDFQADHRRHIVDLRECIISYGGQAKDHSDVKGFFIKGMTALQSMVGDEMALKAMQTNEKLTNSEYAEALADLTIPDDVRAIIARNRSDEARHLEWINRAISSRAWEEERPSV
jgi:uncharacterized protein (TIGR02284 family)